MKYSNLILLISILFCSCSQIDDVATSQPKETNIDISAATDNSYVQSRAETIEPFGNGDNLGLYILSHEKATPFAGNTNNLNIKATYKYDEEKDSYSWKYVMQSSDYIYSSLYITTNNEGESADFYAYSPWSSTNKYANTYVNFPNFNLDVSTSQIDLKWARQNNENTNKGIVSDGGNKKVYLTFQRATALISCKFATSHTGNQEGTSEIHITGFKVNKGDCPLYKSGTLNIINGQWTKTEAESYSYRRATTLELGTSTELHPYPSTYDIYFLPITQDEMNSSEGDYLMHITFNQYANINGTPAEIRLKKSQFLNGLEAGKKYTLYITWEDYLKIDKIQVDDNWTDHDVINKEI